MNKKKTATTHPPSTHTHTRRKDDATGPCPPVPLVVTDASSPDGGPPPSLAVGRRWLPLVLASTPHAGGATWRLAPLPPAAGGARLPRECRGVGIEYGLVDALDATAVVVGG